MNLEKNGVISRRAVLLAGAPALADITLPGMLIGSPAMAGEKTEPITLYAVTKDGKAESAMGGRP